MNMFRYSTLLLVSITTASRANDIQVSNTEFVPLSGSTARIQFDVAWKNSWRGSGVANWDAAWIFVKYKQNNGVWRHVQLAATGHTAPAGSTIQNGLVNASSAYHAVTNPVVGVFIHRDADGTGPFAANSVQLLWNFGSQGIIAINDILEVRVFATEMVYINEGQFQVGDGSSQYTFKYADSSVPYAITTEGSIPISQASGAPGLWSDATFDISSGTLHADFPKGYRAFYCMKYELSQQQYADFLNTLTRTQQAARVAADLSPGITSVPERYVMRPHPTVYQRTVIACDATIDAQAPVPFYCDGNGNGIGGEANDGQWVVGNFISGFDLASYLDWSGLRLMTELEYEKACRGPLPPVAGEFAWGNAQVEPDDDYVLENLYTAQENISSGYLANAGNASLLAGLASVVGPVRVGIFAANPANSGRMTSGAGYYGAMELTGNVEELVVSIHNANGRSYTGLHGNGELLATGTYDVGNWPTTGLFVRGRTQGGQVSLRSGSPGPGTARSGRNGGRGVRTAQ